MNKMYVGGLRVRFHSLGSPTPPPRIYPWGCREVGGNKTPLSYNVMKHISTRYKLIHENSSTQVLILITI